MPHYLAIGGLSQQLSPITAFLHSAPVLVVYLLCLGLFLLLARARRLGGPQFRHVIFALGFGILGAFIIMPASAQVTVASLATPGKKMTLWAVLGGILLIEIIMIIRDRRKGGSLLEE